MRAISHMARMLSVFLLFLTAASPLDHAATAQAGPSPRIVVIVAADSTLRDVSHALLKRIFLGEPAEHDGARIVPLNYGPDDPLRIAFDRLALGLSPEAAGRYWVDRRIRGQGLPPRAVPTQSLVRAVVARLRGSIGYITPDQLDPSVRALTIDGAHYTDPTYQLSIK